MQMPQKYGAASSYGKKYALGNLFLIDDTQDADSTNGTAGVVDKIKAKAKPTITSEQFEKAKEYIKAGGSLNAIKSKYKLTETTENALLNEQKSSTKTTS